MSTIILRTATQFLMPLLVLLSLFLLLRGHNEPGGGFIGGLLASAAVSLYAVAYDAAAARRLLRVHPHQLIGAGLFCSLGAGLAPVLLGQPMLTGVWVKLWLGPFEAYDLGSPLLFDIGVDVVVLGVVSTVILTLLEE